MLNVIDLMVKLLIIRILMFINGPYVVTKRERKC